MEFLDDLIKNQEDKEKPEQENEPQADAWDTFLNSVEYQDPYKQTENASKSRGRARKPRGRGKKTRKSRRGKSLFLFLAVSVFIAWGVIFALILRYPSTTASIISSFFSNKKSAAPQNSTLETSDTGTPQSITDSTNALSPDGSPGEESKATPTVPPPPSALQDAPFTRFDREIKENPGLLDLYQLRGQEYLDLGAYKAALADFNYVKTVDDNRAEAYAGMGRVYFHMRRWSEAERAFQDAIERNDELSDAYFWLGHIYHYKGEYKAATVAFDLAAEYNRGNAAAEAWLAIASAQLDDYQETLGAVTRAMSITHELAVNYVASSRMHLLEEPPDVDSAQADLLYARELDPNNTLSLNALASFYLNYRPERLAEAELLAHYAYNWAQNDIERAIALQTLGRIYMEKGLKGDAEKTFVQAMELATVDGIVILAGLPDDFMRSRE